MPINELLADFLSEVAKSADICLTPWKHSVLKKGIDSLSETKLSSFNELILRIECRDTDGLRNSDKDLDLEIFRSGSELNITLAWHNYPTRPILWQGKHSLWMDSINGQRSVMPIGGEPLEALARRLRSKISSLV
tara:strand:+ start:412 stop:816 length:405 start_codon:yes stop_codon:yes gene_type:complete